MVGKDPLNGVWVDGNSDQVRSGLCIWDGDRWRDWTGRNPGPSPKAGGALEGRGRELLLHEVSGVKWDRVRR